MNTVKDTFSAGASAYDRVARIQPLVAARLAASLDCKPARILEIGCGTGVLSSHLRSTFPDAELILTDISPSMLEICKRKLKGNGIFRVMNGERPDTDLGLFDLIISNLAMQWFEDMPGGIDRLSKLLAPGGRFSFSTLGEKNFTEWRALLETRNLPSGLHLYPDIASFPWPGDMLGRVEEEFIIEKHDSGIAFLKAIRGIGAGTPRKGYRPLSSSDLKRLLSDSKRGFTATYHILYCSFPG